jgi:VCBS repeat protein
MEVIRFPAAILILAPIFSLLPDGVRASDCNQTGVEDSLEIARGTSKDCDGDGVPDECEAVPFEESFLMPASLGIEAFEHLAFADLDGDGDIDLAGENEGGIQFFSNDGTGQYAPWKTLPPVGSPGRLVIADLDGDGTPDLVSIDTSSNGIMVRLNLGGGNFADASLYPLAIIKLTDVSLLLTDLDGDGDLDVLLGSEGHPRLSISLNDGHGGFPTAVPLEIDAGVNSFAAGDVDGDSLADLAVLTQYGIHILKGKGGGAFGTPEKVDWPPPPHSEPKLVFLRDADGDGHLDLITVQDTVAFFPNDGRGGFTAFRESGSSIEGATEGILADLDGDGDLDLALFCLDGPEFQAPSRSVAIFLSDGGGDFELEDWYFLWKRGYSPLAGDVDGDGDLDLIMGDRSCALFLLRNKGGGAFAGSRTYLLDVGQTMLAASDLDGDHFLDLAVASRMTSAPRGNLSVLWGKGGGKLSPPLRIADAEPFLLQAADADGDGLPDLVIRQDTGNLSIFLNQGDRSFAGEEKIVCENPVSGFVLADLDGDGLPDLTLVSEAAASLGVLMNAGGGSYAPILEYPLASSARSIAAADFNGDGRVDIAAGRDGQVSVLFNQGDGHLGIPVDTPVAGIPDFLQAGDLDGDGHLDLAAASSMTASVLWNDGDRSFQLDGYRAVPLLGCTENSCGGHEVSLVLEDLDGDGRTDIVLSSSDKPEILSAMLSRGGRSFEARAIYVDSSLRSIQGGDFNGDGSADLAFLGGRGVEVLLKRPGLLQGRDCDRDGVIDACQLEERDCDRDGALDRCQSANLEFDFSPEMAGGIGKPRHGESISSGDVDGDGSIDLATDNGIFLNEGHGGFFVPAGAFAESLGAVTLADLDRDGLPDLAATTTGIELFRNVGGGAFSPVKQFPAGNFPRLILAADLDGDSSTDIATGNYNSRNFTILFNDGGWTFERTGEIENQVSMVALATADFDGDGDLDLAVANQSDTVYLHLNDGRGWFAYPLITTIGGEPRSLSSGDLDGDGDADLALVDSLDGKVRILLNGKGGAFSPQTPLEPAISSPDLAMSDFDGDGDPDLVVGGFEAGCRSYSWPSLRFFENDGRAGFRASRQFPASGAGGPLIVADLNGDGRPDIAKPTYGSVAMFLNRPPRASSGDCNSNGLPDACDIASGTSLDRNGDGIPDECQGPPFHRGDFNVDGEVDISDAIQLLGYLFLGEPPSTCLESGDVDDSEDLDISDPIRLMNFLFLGGPRLPDPGPPSSPCGLDPKDPEGRVLGCRSYPWCSM